MANMICNTLAGDNAPQYQQGFWGSSGGYVQSSNGPCVYGPAAFYKLLIRDNGVVAYQSAEENEPGIWYTIPPTTQCPLEWWPEASMYIGPEPTIVTGGGP